MGTSASEIIALAQNTKALSKEQLARILKVAPTMTAEDLEKLRQMILTVRGEEVKSMKHKLETYQKAASVEHEWKADKVRDQRNTQEGAVKREDLAQAETLIQNI